MKKIGFIGAGNMATAIIKGIVARNKSAEGIYVYDLSEEKQRLIQELGAAVCGSCADVTEKSDIIVLAVKPQNYAEAIASLRSAATLDKTFVSIAAGISIAYVQRALGMACPVVRVMPNTPLLLGKGASALCPSENISDEDKAVVESMFAGSGVCEYITEEHMNEIIAVNGSSPAYIYLFAKAMADYAASCGIDYDKAMNLICATLEGSAAMLRESGDSADVLIEKVSSKGGTTIAALEQLRAHGFTQAIHDAMDACTKRAEELGR
ncbi:MAG: pyrroline-5-carboxylate reductase [Ruminococcus sp.]|nr:pyrroline-5-carboxylate reductase [Ruminococcus sp.]